MVGTDPPISDRAQNLSQTPTEPVRKNVLLANAVIFHNALDIAEIVRQLLEKGCEIDPEDLATSRRT